MSEPALITTPTNVLFDPNEGGAKNSIVLPGAPMAVYSADQYVNLFNGFVKSVDSDPVAAMKALNTPPQALAFGRISYMPEAYNKGVLQWPGIAPEALTKVARENVAPQLIIGMRVDDVMRYSELSTHPWRPGWLIEHKDEGHKLTEAERRELRDAQEFIMNCNIDGPSQDARIRDEQGYTDFKRYLGKVTRDSLTYDEMATWTDMDRRGRVQGFAPFSASNVRLTGPAGYEGDKTEYAVMVDDAGSVRGTFTRDEMIFYNRNNRTNPDVMGYGWAEIEIGIRLIQGFQNALDMNINTFNRNAIPNGILTLSGDQVTQKQLDVLNRVWTNLKQGVSKAWALPVIGLNGNGKLDILDLSRVKGNEGMYQDFMNMVAGAFCTVYRFPVRRIGYRISGKGKDTEPWKEGDTSLTDEDDPGLAPLLTHIESMINQYILSTRWPMFRFRFSGKNPKEDAREFQSRRDAMTWGEARQATGNRPLAEMAPNADMKVIAEVMDMAPIDPNLAGVFQSVAAAYIAQKFPKPEGEGAGGSPATPGNRMTKQKDPAKSEEHGATGGVRRDSAAEKKK